MSSTYNYPYDIPVEFAGLSSTTHRMQCAGWEMMYHAEHDKRRTHIAMRHKGLEVHAMTDDFDLYDIAQDWYMRNAPMFTPDPRASEIAHHFERSRERPAIRINVIARDVYFKTIELRFEQYKYLKSGTLNIPINAGRSYMLSELPWFDTMPTMTPKDEGKIIYVEDANVTDLMTIILEKQAPKQAEIRERLRKEENRSRIIKPEANIVRLFA